MEINNCLIGKPLPEVPIDTLLPEILAKILLAEIDRFQPIARKLGLKIMLI